MYIHNDESISLPEHHYLRGIDYIELYVANARQAAYFFQKGYGFVPVAYMGLETGERERVSFLLQQGSCRLILTAPLHADGMIAEHVRVHGDSVKDIAFHVSDARVAFTEAVKRGAHPVQEPVIIDDAYGKIVKASIATFGDTIHSFIQYMDPHSRTLPGFQQLHDLDDASSGIIHRIDHCAISLPYGAVDTWVDFYTEVFGFHLLHADEIFTEYSAMKSKALQDASESINFVFVETVPGKRKSQVEEFLAYHQGPGVQHIAFHTDNIIQAIRIFQEQGVTFTPTPSSYYELLPERVGTISENIDDLNDVNVLVDRDEWGYLLQIFSQPLHHRPTLFIEIIQRKQARGFGNGNITALFKAVEREQAKRGNL